MKNQIGCKRPHLMEISKLKTQNKRLKLEELIIKKVMGHLKRNRKKRRLKKYPTQMILKPSDKNIENKRKNKKNRSRKNLKHKNNLNSCSTYKLIFNQR